VIIRRRDKVVAYWIGQTNPLDYFAVGGTTTGAELAFDNAAMRLRVARPGATYKVNWLALDNLGGTEQAIGPAGDVNDPRVAIPDAAWGPADDAGFRYAIASIKTIHPAFPNWTNPVVVTVRDRNGSIDVVGIERPTSDVRTGLQTGPHRNAEQSPARNGVAKPTQR
jgi:hypothetical protein